MNPRSRAAVFLSLCAAAGCAPKPAETPPPPIVDPAPAPEPTEQQAPPAPAPVDEDDAQPPGGSASAPDSYTQCSEPRLSMCTREYRPVCADVDTAIRCITAPCPSTEKKTYSNGCTACADEKVTGYALGACAPEDGAPADGAPAE